MPVQDAKYLKEEMRHISQLFLFCKSIAHVNDFIQLHVSPSLGTEAVRAKK